MKSIELSFLGNLSLFISEKFETGSSPLFEVA